MIELNQRIFPYSVGVDINENNEHETFNFTFTYPNINALGKNATQEERVHVITAPGMDFFSAVHNLSSKLQFPLFNKHLKVIVLQEEVASNPKYVREIIDGINRDFIMNTTMQMAVVKESAEELLMSLPDAERQEVVEGTLLSMLSNIQESSNFTPKRLTEFLDDMDNRGASIVPVAKLTKDEVEFSGGAVFKDFALIGYVNYQENKDIAILTQNLNEDGFHTLYNGINLSILATGLKSKTKLEQSDNLKIVYNILIEGQIHEYTLANGKGIDTDEMKQEMEAAFKKDIEESLNKTIKKIQKEFKADVIKAADYLRKYHNKIWVQVEDDWDEVFSNAEITAKVEVKIRRRGLTK